MASIKDLILSIESADSSFDEKLAAINKMEETLVAMRQQEEQAVQDNVDLIVEAIKLMEKKVTDQLEIAKSIVPEKGDKGDKGERGADGKAGRDGLDGRDGKDGRDGVDGADGVSVTDAKIDFDGSLVITLSTGREINVGEVVAPDLAEKIKVITTMSTNGAVVIQDEGTTVSGGVKSINFVGATVTATNSGDDVTVSVAGSVYNPSNVAITGGSINGTSIGATTASTGAFTTLSASSTVSGTGFSTYLASPPAIGGTTPAAGTFTTLTVNSTAQFGRSSANYFEFAGAATTKTVEAKALGSDTNIAFTIDSKGTGAVNLAAGSSGVNISNGGTVTAITRTASGSGYTSLPSVAITAPTTAGGVQATATCTLGVSSATIGSGGTGYTLNDVITISGGTTGASAVCTVSAVSGGVVTAVTFTSFGTYTVLPTNPASTTGGTGTGLTLNLGGTFVNTGFTITNAGSGYVEQPTVTFSGGGGSGAAAYATVGSGTVARSLGSTFGFFTPAGVSNSQPSFQVADNSTAVANYLTAIGTSGVPYLQANGTGTNISTAISSKGTGSVSIWTNSANQVQMTVSHTASAVNYVQVTGAATGGVPTISAQGSDTNIAVAINSKGTGGVRLAAQNTDFLFATGGTGGATLSAGGGSTNVDLLLTPKGTGNVRFGTYTATVSIITGYIEIKDSGGTVRRLAVVS